MTAARMARGALEGKREWVDVDPCIPALCCHIYQGLLIPGAGSHRSRLGWTLGGTEGLALSNLSTPSGRRPRQRTARLRSRIEYCTRRR